MKKITLTFSLFFFSFIAYCGCPTVTAVMMRSDENPNDYTLVISFIRNGENFHIEDTIFCDGTVFTSGCNTFDVTGTLNIQFSCPGPDTPSAKVTSFLGPCGNETLFCDSVKVGPSGGPTPVVLSRFGAQRNGNNVIVNWRTEQEINSDKFIIERSLDNKSFEQIGSVKSHGTSSVANNYTFIDKTNINKGVSFYRVKMIDKDGSVTYTPAQSIKGLLGKTDLVVFPNPSYGRTKITVTNLNEDAIIQVIDNSGRLVKSISLIHNNALEINNLQKGGYFIKMTGKESGETLVRKLTVVN